MKLINKKYYEENGEKKMIYYVSDGLYGSLNNVIYDHVKLKLEYHKKYKNWLILHPYIVKEWNITTELLKSLKKITVNY